MSAFVQTVDIRKEANNRYLWYEVEKDLWYAFVEDVTYKPKESKPTPLYDFAAIKLTSSDKTFFVAESIDRQLEYKVTER